MNSRFIKKLFSAGPYLHIEAGTTLHATAGRFRGIRSGYSSEGQMHLSAVLTRYLQGRKIKGSSMIRLPSASIKNSNLGSS